jgi:hypothetical protein
MKKIKLEIEISSVKSALKEVREDVRFAIKTTLGIQSSDIEIDVEIDE